MYIQIIKIFVKFDFDLLMLLCSGTKYKNRLKSIDYQSVFMCLKRGLWRIQMRVIPEHYIMISNYAAPNLEHGIMNLSCNVQCIIMVIQKRADMVNEIVSFHLFTKKYSSTTELRNMVVYTNFFIFRGLIRKNLS